MIRNAACALLRRSTASASLSRATQSPALSARGFHAAVAKSGQRSSARADTMLLARRHGHYSTAKNSMENISSVEEKKAELLRIFFKEEAAAVACKRNQEKLAEMHDTTRLVAEERRLKKEMEALKEANKAKTEELLAAIVRQGASGVDQETLLLARLARDGQDIQDIKRTVSCIQISSVAAVLVFALLSLFKKT